MMGRIAWGTGLSALLVLGLAVGGHADEGSAPRSAAGAAQGPATAESVPLGDGQTLGPPLIHANLAVYPVVGVVGGEPLECLTLDEALAEGLVEVSEKEDAEVSSVLVSNRASLPLYLMAGEVILGGKQDRVVAQDTIVPARAKRYEVRVFCVEPRRWSGETVEFGASNLQASTAVRKAAQLHQDQGDVWDEVARANEAAEVQPDTGAYRASATESEIAQAAAAYVDAILPRLAQEAGGVGMVVAIDGEIVSADVYASPTLFRKLQRKLLASHAREAAAGAGQETADRPAPGLAEAARFLTEARGGAEVSTEDLGTHARRQVASETAVGFQTMGGAGMAAQVVHENYYSGK